METQVKALSLDAVKKLIFLSLAPISTWTDPISDRNEVRGHLHQMIKSPFNLEGRLPLTRGNSKFIFETNLVYTWNMPFLLDFTRRKTTFVATCITKYKLNPPHMPSVIWNHIYESGGDYTDQGSSSTRLIMTQKWPIMIHFIEPVNLKNLEKLTSFVETKRNFVVISLKTEFVHGINIYAILFRRKAP